MASTLDNRGHHSRCGIHPGSPEVGCCTMAQVMEAYVLDARISQRSFKRPTDSLQRLASESEYVAGF